MPIVQQLAESCSTAQACHALDLPRSTYYRWRVPPTPPIVRAKPPRSLTSYEEQEVLALLRSTNYADLAPEAVVAALLDQGQYLCSPRTMYRILSKHGEVQERRQQLRHPDYKKPELLAQAPNQIWSWDITRLRGPAKWSYFYLYVILDIFSRRVVGWMVAPSESASLAKRFIQETCDKEQVDPETLTIHSDRGVPMTSILVAQLLALLGVTKSLSRPYTSNDNPYSESQFKTMKYRPEFPDRFDSERAAISFCESFFRWYNTEHRHSGIAMLTPDDVHRGLAKDRIAARQTVLTMAYDKNPERFVGGMPVHHALPDAVWINRPTPDALEIAQ